MLALASLRSGNKVSALRQAREMKLASESREKCNVLLRRVEEVLRAIADAEDSKKVCPIFHRIIVRVYLRIGLVLNRITPTSYDNNSYHLYIYKYGRSDEVGGDALK